MGLLTWVIIGVVILAVVGLGVGTFFSGVYSGAKKVGENPVVSNATQGIKNFVNNNITNHINANLTH